MTVQPNGEIVAAFLIQIFKQPIPIVITSEAKQSRESHRSHSLDCFVASLLAMTALI
jgi:hypothetical protein